MREWSRNQHLLKYTRLASFCHIPPTESDIQRCIWGLTFFSKLVNLQISKLNWNIAQHTFYLPEKPCRSTQQILVKQIIKIRTYNKNMHLQLFCGGDCKILNELYLTVRWKCSQFAATEKELCICQTKWSRLEKKHLSHIPRVVCVHQTLKTTCLYCLGGWLAGNSTKRTETACDGGFPGGSP